MLEVVFSDSEKASMKLAKCYNEKKFLADLLLILRANRLKQK